MAAVQPQQTPQLITSKPFLGVVKTSKAFLGVQICLRFLVISSTLAATCVMVTSKQTKDIFGVSLDARFTYSSSFKFLAIANAAASAFSLLSLFLLFVASHRAANPAVFFFFFINDVLLTCLVMAGCASATAIGIVAKYGNDHTGWPAICNLFERFCDRGTISLALSYFAMALLLVLTVLSAGKSRQIQD